MESETSFQFILQFMDSFQTHRIHTSLILDNVHLDLIPVLAGSSPVWNKGRKLKRYIVDLCPIQKIENYMVDISDAKVSLRIMQNCILYDNQEDELAQANYQVLQQYYETYLINWVNVYRILHFLIPSKADCFKRALILDTRAVCRVNCFQTKAKITHDRILKMLKKFLKDYFQPTLADDVLSKPVQNRIAAWSILSMDFSNLFKREIFNSNQIKLSDRGYSLIDEIMQISNRQDAIDLHESFKKRK